MTTVLSTEAFFERLHATDISRSDILFTEEVDFNPNRFGDLMKTSDKFDIVENREGLFSEVRQGSDPANASRQTGALDWHIDGLARRTSKLPQFLLLHCVDPGQGGWRTDFTDATRAFNSVFDPKVAEEWLSAGNEVVDRFRRFQQDMKLTYISTDSTSYRHDLVLTHPRTGEKVLLVGDRASISPHYPEGEPRKKWITLREQGAFIACVTKALDDSIARQIKWTSNLMAVADQLRYPHRRAGGTGLDHRRTLYRMWLNPKGVG
jgi:alpha-ketoglutarate-dependent taurine dioxygenase